MAVGFSIFSLPPSLLRPMLFWPAQATNKTIVLDVKNRPPIVRPSLLRVPGVKDVKTSQANQLGDFMATTTFDDAVANEAALIAATAKAGYSSHVASTN
jgi:copper chaperone CopZ